MASSAGLNAMLIQSAENLAVEMAEWAKQNAPWTDRTGDLRKYIEPFARIQGDSVVAGAGERMEYGKYIEARKDKGILQPMIDHFLPDAQKLYADTAKEYAAAQMRAAANGNAE